MNQAQKTNIGIFGYGHMGQAILKLLQQSGKSKGKLNFFVYSIGVKKIKNAACLDSLEKLINQSDIIFLCIKPQDFYNLKPFQSNHKIFISIMAGVKTDNIRKIVSSSKIIRVMPNLPLQVGQAVLAWQANTSRLAKNQLALIKNLFSNFGYSFQVNREAEIDKITAISGSGPAYVFLFIDALIKAATNLGLPQQQAEQIILQLTTGSLEYFKSVKNVYSPEQLIAMVKSKKGTTEAALNKLNTEKFYNQWQGAILAAHQRAQAISNYEIK